MYKKLLLITVIILIGLAGLSTLGFYSISLHADGLAGKRAADFTEVTEQIRIDVKAKLDSFIKTEQSRPYTDYQYYYIPQTSNQQRALLRSPLGDSLNHGLAYGHFQIEPDGTVIAPYFEPGKLTQTKKTIQNYIASIETNLLSALNGSLEGTTFLSVNRTWMPTLPAEKEYSSIRPAPSRTSRSRKLLSQVQQQEQLPTEDLKSKGSRSKKTAYRIESLQEAQQSQVLQQSRAVVEENIATNTIQTAYGRQGGKQLMPGMMPGMMAGTPVKDADEELSKTPSAVTSKSQDNISDKEAMSGKSLESQTESKRRSTAEQQKQIDLAGSDNLKMNEKAEQSFKYDLANDTAPPQTMGDTSSDTVQIRIEPFAPVVIPADENTRTIFDKRIFLLRHIQIEQKHFLQGFELDQSELLRQIESSAANHMRTNMDFRIATTEPPKAAYTAILDFGFTDIMLGLMELQPEAIAMQVSQLKNSYFAIIAIVFLAVALALAGLWKSSYSQLKLAQKKDDFISAVSHELRTPLTTIRMYTEMLEKDWVKTDEKRSEYYSTMRQESERLTRLIENVLDFSRIQRNRKKYSFKIGDINECVNDVVDMMAPCAAQAGFTLKKDFTTLPQTAFDSDAVMQIVINLLDNAIKYAHNAEEKIIMIRTKTDSKYVFIEVEDHGPGIPHLQRKKIFEEFYRCGDESTRETAGTGLGLALVKKFAQAHNGFVEILAAKPAGALFRVALPKS